MKQPITLSIFFPAFNEEDNLVSTVEGAIAFCNQELRIADYEIIIVNDGSSDATGTIANSLSATHDQVRAINHEKNMGYGCALRSGIQAARFDYIFFTDTDLQFDINELSLLLDQVPAYEFVSGYRAPRRDPFMRLVNASGWNILNRALFGLRSRDIDCAFKLFRRDLVQNMHIQSTGAMISAEILIRAKRQGVEIKEVPVTHLPRVMGSPTGAKPIVIVRAFKEMLMLYRGELGSNSQKQALKFMTVGVINTLIDIVVYVFLTRGLHLASVTDAKLLSFLAGTVSSFVLNRFWTFDLTTRVRMAEIIRFYSVVSVSLLVNLIVMNVLTNGLHIYDLVALMLTTVFTFVISFTLSRAWVFMVNVQDRVPQLTTPTPTRP